jgi:hypothetical protein
LAIFTGPPSWQRSSRPTTKRFRKLAGARSMMWPVSLDRFGQRPGGRVGD